MKSGHAKAPRANPAWPADSNGATVVKSTTTTTTNTPPPSVTEGTPRKKATTNKLPRRTDTADAPTPASSSATPATLEPTTNGHSHHGTAATNANGNNATKPSRKRNSSLSGSKTYLQIIHEAILALGDRTGSSIPALTKWILQEYPQLDGPQFKNRILQAVKSGTKAERFQKVKCSYKIAAVFKEKERQAARKKKNAVAAAAAAAAKKKKKAATPPTLAQTQAAHEQKLAQLQKSLSPEALARKKVDLARQEEATRQRLQAEKVAKERADRLRRRRFPMEDTRLHQEDAELHVKPPADVLARPYLPYFWYMTTDLHDPSRHGKTSSQILQASKVDGLDTGNHGLVPDLLGVYHFFRGDVQFRIPDERELVPPFSLAQLVFATEQILNGNAKRSRIVPPLLSSLFCTCLQILCRAPEDTAEKTSQTQLQKDLHRYLAPALTPASWADVLYLYMDAMERFYATDASRDPNVLPPLQIDVEYLLAVRDDIVVPMTPATTVKGKSSETNLNPLPGGYFAYLGDPRGILFRAFSKLGRQDPWLLTAEELIVLLRVLTDDILASHPAISQDVAAREEEMLALSKAKRAADTKLRKVRLAFEGPKKPATATVKKPEENKEVTKDEKTSETENQNGNEDEKEEILFKPTATQKQLESAVKAQQKASEAYEKGIRKLTARTEPIGYDRNFNAIYCFRHDPEVLYVEDLRQPSTVANHLPLDMQFKRRSWHLIETTALFDSFTGSLDIRGRREHDLYEELVGPQGAQQSLRRFLHDNMKEQNEAVARVRELESLKKRLEVARVKCDEEQGRRSGRLAGQAGEELSSLEFQIEILESRINGTSAPEPRDYEELTGLTLLRKFDSNSGMGARRTREQKQQTKTHNLPILPCSKMCGTGNIDGTGLVGLLVSGLLEVEEICETLAPWERTDTTRGEWVARLENAVHTWNAVSPMVLGLADAPPMKVIGSPAQSSPPNGSSGVQRSARRTSLDSLESASKKRKVETPPPTSTTFHSAANIVSMIRQPLIDLEARVAAITNLDVASKDADIADDNLSTDGSEDDQAIKEKLERAWKRQIHRLRNTLTHRYGQIREFLVAAIAAARKAHVPEVVAELRAALLQYHPGAASECKYAAIKVLLAHGDYEPDEDEEEEEQYDVREEGDEVEIPSVICAEAAMLASSLDGSEDATRADWIDSVKACKTISRLASLVGAFVKNAQDKMGKLEDERDDLLAAIKTWEKEEERRVKNRGGKKPVGRPTKDSVGPSEVWANVRFSDEICMAKAENWPWWPARKCTPKDGSLARSLAGLDRSLVALIGEMGGLRVVKTESIKAFSGTLVEDEDLGQYNKSVRSQLDDCMAMGRRIARGMEKKR
ncbi:predicted protein [Phaeodactylum tricornutum CCAP 1055/1]|jgi:histone H1/5|uniref:H15 domain-containing protein n=1 Tax=Phaeodactylum tricornutum (strain CCAP 1055/1) TaxID=556484 RepID=B7GE97_PHATC|nr:predicted protein [Phaeodactylum tricornutum CCAP 1055/1]EEC43115.1 predicted protein [Phaeodactylum tricornutum CCAP 1055/1]|eukprot:XP_002185446.1 predicted protein [Phaeodactylum tricornutum CCAP 1055/1]